MPHYKIYVPDDKQWYEAEAPGVEEACAIYGVRSSDVYVYEVSGRKKLKLISKPSAERKRSAYLGGE